MSTSRSLGAVARFAASQHGVVTRSQAASVEFNRNVVARLKARGFWREPAPGVLVVASAPETWHQRVAIATLFRGGLPTASHPTAARLHRVDGFDTDERVAVTVLRGHRVNVPGVERHLVIHAISEDDVVEIDGIRCTSLARTLVDLAGTEPADVLERAFDDFERRGFSLTWIEQTAQRVHRPGQRGTKIALAEVKRRRTRGRVRGSWFQKLVRECLTSPLIPGLEEEYEIRDGDGSVVARVDLAVPLVRLGIEAHSRKHHTGPVVEAYDEHRDNRVAEQGWDIRYLGYADTSQTPRQVRRFIERTVARRAKDLGVTLPTN